MYIVLSCILGTMEMQRFFLILNVKRQSAANVITKVSVTSYSV